MSMTAPLCSLPLHKRVHVLSLECAWAASYQRDLKSLALSDPPIILTHTCLERAALAAIAKIEALPAQKGKVKRIRLEELQ